MHRKPAASALDASCASGNDFYCKENKQEAFMGKIALPEGKKIAVNLGVDFDAQCIWLGSFNYLTPSFMSRGQFGAEVGVPRLLDLFERKGITTSFYIPGHTVDTFPEISRKIMDAGHEIGHHGYYHENPAAIKKDTEKRLMDLAFASYKKHFGIRPTGYRAPYWEFSESTLDLVEDAGFLYDSSMMARDLTPYRIQRWQINWEKANVAGPASKVLEIPISWYLDDFPALAYIGGAQEGLADTDVVFRRWRDIFDYAYERLDSPIYPMAVHPQIIGQAHHIMAYEKLIEHMMSKEGVWFATCQQIAEAWVDDEEDKRKMTLPDVRGVQTAPADSPFGPKSALA
jgi:peptidoglycan/xylan/chitin deacetylase (PgdA/CDA1 family)